MAYQIVALLIGAMFVAAGVWIILMMYRGSDVDAFVGTIGFYMFVIGCVIILVTVVPLEQSVHMNTNTPVQPCLQK